MNKKMIGFLIGAATTLTVALCWFMTRSEDRYGNDSPLSEPISHTAMHDERPSMLSRIYRPKATQDQLSRDRQNYIDILRNKFEKDGLSASLRDAIDRPMSDLYRQDLLINYIKFSLEANGLDDTIKNIQSGLQAGSQRDKCIMLAFANSTEDLEVLHRNLLATGSAQEKTSAAEGLQSSIGDRDIPLSQLLTIFNDPFLTDYVLKGAANALRSPFNPTADRGKFIDKNVSDLVGAIDEGRLEKGSIGKFVREASINAGGESSFHLWNSINNADRMEGLSIHPTTYKMLANSMMKTDPSKAFSSLAESKIPIPSEVIAESARNWMDQQNVQSVNWLNSKGSNLKPEFKDAFITGFIEYNLANGGIEEGMQWSQQLQDPSLREEFQTRIDKARAE